MNISTRLTMITLLATIMLSFPSLLWAQDQEYTIRPKVPDYSRPFLEPGSASNPYVVRERYDGQIEIRSKYLDTSRPFGEAGSPVNPWILEKR